MLRYLRTPLDLPIALLVASALVGIWVSYDRTTSLVKFTLIVAAIVIYYFLVLLRAAPKMINVFSWGLVLGGAALAIYFVTQNDYSEGTGKFDAITAIGLFLNRISPQLPFHRPHPNIVSGVLEIALPINLALAWGVRAAKPRTLFAIAVLLFFLILFGLVMTSSRGAWLALGIVASLAVLYKAASRAWLRYTIPLASMVLLALVIALLRPSDLFSFILERILGSIPSGEQVVSRMELYNQTWRLIRDYYFTGSGLGVFPMVLSTYALLIEVPFLSHTHNLFLQMWIEQGLVGFVAFAWLILEFYAWAWRRRADLNWLALGAIASMTVMLLHGLVDVLLYSSRALPLMFVPVGLAIASGQSSSEAKVASPVIRRFSWVTGLRVLAVLAALALLAALGGQAIAALWYANLGSVAQTRIELGQYQFPDRLVEYIRHDGDLSQAQMYFQQALMLDSTNVTAVQRSSEIRLARGEFDAARIALERAYRSDPADPVTWQLLGDAYLGLGRLEEASTWWSKIKDARSKLGNQAWARYERNGDFRRASWVRLVIQKTESPPP